MKLLLMVFAFLFAGMAFDVPSAEAGCFREERQCFREELRRCRQERRRCREELRQERRQSRNCCAAPVEDVDPAPVEVEAV